MASESASLPPLHTSQPTSQTSSPRSSGPKTPLSLDLSDLPPLTIPSPPSNTLLITNLNDPAIFHAENLQTIRSLIDQHASIHTWSPLRSFRRIIVVFYDVDAAKLIKQMLDGEIVFECRIRVYFGAHTELSSTDQHLQAPKSDKLFFISPPPSPPHGWEIKNEEPPNKEVHAEDLAHALARLHAHKDIPASPDYSEEDRSGETDGGRKRSGSIIVYHPDHHGDSPNLPAISVEDTTESPLDVSPMETDPRAPFAHTMRPPVELMDIE